MHCEMFLVPLATIPNEDIDNFIQGWTGYATIHGLATQSERLGTYRSFWKEWLVSDGWRIRRMANVFSSTQRRVEANISYIRLGGKEHNDGVFKLARVISWKESLSLPKIFAFPPPSWLWHVSISKAYRNLAPISKPTTTK